LKLSWLLSPSKFCWVDRPGVGEDPLDVPLHERGEATNEIRQTLFALIPDVY